MKITALIPARLNSKRFDRKLMMDLCGKPVITRTYNAVLSSKLFSDVVVITQDSEIHQEILSNNGKSVLIDKDYKSGTDRIADACVNIETDIVINIQGDEPFINKNSLELLINIFKDDINNEINYGSLMKEIQNISETRVILKDLLNLSENKVTIDLIQTTVCKFFKISKNEMLSPRRSRYLVRPRQTAIYLSKMLTSKSLPEIGRAFSNRDHTTVIHSVKTIDKLRKEDTELNTNIDSLKNKILYNQENEI